MAGKVFGASALAALIMVATGCGGSGTGAGTTAASCSNVADSQGVAKDHVLVGVVGDFTGPTVGSQGPFLHGIEASLKFANDHGGICGKSIQFTEVDDKYTSNLGQAAYKQFTEQSPAYFMFGNN